MLLFVVSSLLLLLLLSETVIWMFSLQELLGTRRTANQKQEVMRNSSGEMADKVSLCATSSL